MVADNVNFVFEMLGGFYVFLNVRRLHRDKKVRGVSITATMFFVVWGFWNLFYYPHLGQLWSAVGASSVASMNCIWLGQMVYYTRKENNGRGQWHKENI